MVTKDDHVTYEEATKSKTWRDAMKKEMEAIEKNNTWELTKLPTSIAKMDTIRILLSLSAQHSWSIYQLDVKIAFLHGELKEEVYIQQPIGFVKLGEEEKVYRLRKVLYGLKQAPRAWYNKIETYFLH